MNQSDIGPVARGSRYVLMTAAHNEEAFIEKTIASVLSQTQPPLAWVIVSDNSSDQTDAIVQRYETKYPFIRFLRVQREPGRDFRSKVVALHQGCRLLQDEQFDFVGNLDADITLEKGYFACLVDRFKLRPKLGIASGFVHEELRGRFRNRSSNRTDSVPHCAQLVRRECYEEIGGYAVLKYGGEDWYAQTCARMNGWEAEAFPELKIYHHRHTGAGSNLLRDRYRLGRLDYSLGSDPVFEFFKCARRWREQPLVVGAMARLIGFASSYILGVERVVPAAFVRYLRREQRSKLMRLFDSERARAGL
jgi:poly-beta-1,6-N-acetyl-D-glucosamine synthase